MPLLFQGISAILCSLYIIKNSYIELRKEHWTLDKDYVKTQLRIGIPMALQFSITAAGAVILQSALNNLGSKIIASYTAASKVQQVFMQPSFPLSSMATYAGQNLELEK